MTGVTFAFGPADSPAPAPKSCHLPCRVAAVVEVIGRKIGKTFLHVCTTLSVRLSRRGHPRKRRTMAPTIERVAIVRDPGMVPAAENHQAEADLPIASIGREATMAKTTLPRRTVLRTTPLPTP